MTMPTEKQLDHALNNAFVEQPEFARWFLSMTKFSEVDAKYLWSRADNPWGKVKLEVYNSETGVIETVEKESETDLLVVFEVSPALRIALHIENKLASGRFTHLQPELYAARANAWKGNPRYENYSEWETILVAPLSFCKRNSEDVEKFGHVIFHEDLAHYIPEFRSSR